MSKPRTLAHAPRLRIIHCAPDVQAEAWQYPKARYRHVYVQVAHKGRLIGVVGVRVPR